MRRIILFLFAIALLGCGLSIAWMEVIVAPTIYWSGLFVSLTLASLGAYLLWDDFVKPLLSNPPHVG